MSGSGETLAEFRRGIVQALPILVGVAPFGLLLGAQAAHAGLGTVGIGILCALNFAGGSEFVAVQLWRDPPPLLLIAGATLLVNSRHILMGASLTPYLRRVKLPTALAALFVMADEIWALGLDDARRRAAAHPDRELSLPFYFGVAASLYVVWVCCAMIGAALGPILGDPHVLGFDMAFTAVFLVLLRGLWRGFSAARPWLASLVVASLTHLLVPGAWYVAAGTLAGLAAALVAAPRS